jgi:hypothetical protein
MVVWNNYYRFSAEEVEAIGTSDSGYGSHPYMLTVYFKSGNKLSVSYADIGSRKEAMIDLSRQIDREKRQDAEKMLLNLYLIKDATNRIDKRQLRIWKQLKTLLGVKVEELDDA